MLITCVIRNARAHRLQWSGPTVRSSTVVTVSQCFSIFLVSILVFHPGMENNGLFFPWFYVARRSTFSPIHTQ